MEYTGFEPVASTMRMWRAPNCANTPFLTFGNHHVRFPHGNNGARTHDLPLVRRALSQLSYVSTCRMKTALQFYHAGLSTTSDTGIISRGSEKDKRKMKIIVVPQNQLLRIRNLLLFNRKPL